MERKYIIGIDVGSQSSKVVIYDLQGNMVCEGKKRVTTDAHAATRYRRAS